MEQSIKNFNPGLLRYAEGDATMPRGGGHRLIVHICNDVGGWGRGFVTALSKRWKKPEENYRLWYRKQVEDRNKFELGSIQVVDIQSDLAVVNMIAQHGIASELNEEGELIPPIRYDALRTCLEQVAKIAKDGGSSVHGPRFGAGLAAGVAEGYSTETWAKIESMLKEIFIEKGINVTIYDFTETKTTT